MKTVIYFFLIMGMVSALSAQPTTYVIVHGAWGGAWQFKRTAEELVSEGNVVYRPTMTGLGERYHLAHQKIELRTHVLDVINTILFENLTDIVLVGHSYGGMVITGVADSIPERISKLVYLDAFVPENAESVETLLKEEAQNLLAHSKESDIIPFWVDDTTKVPRDVPHPIETMLQPISLNNEDRKSIPSTYILTYDKGKRPQDDDFYKFYQRAKGYNWKTIQMIADHNPQIHSLDELVATLLAEK